MRPRAATGQPGSVDTAIMAVVVAASAVRRHRRRARRAA